MVKRSKTVQRLVWLGVAALLGLPGLADSLHREGLPPIDGITLIGVESGKLKYRTAAGEREVDLTEVVSISIDSVPAFATGVAEFQGGELRAAQRSLKSVWSDANVQWIRHYAGFFLTQVYDQRGELVDAATTYIQLASQGADLAFLSKPPVASLGEADENQKTRIGEQVMAMVAQVKGERRRVLLDYYRQVVGEDVALPQIEDPVGQKEAQADALVSTSKVFMPQLVWNMLDRKGEPKGKWDAVKILAKGDGEAALEAIRPWLDNPGDLPEKLFTKGLAQLMLADQSQEKDQYRDAGLTFMRIVVHFDRAGQAHPLVAPAKLEVAYIHKQIGREDIYGRLLEQVYLAVDDPKAYPQYRQRYYQVLGEEVPQDNDQP